MNIETVKGFRDYTDEDARKRAEIKKILVNTFEEYGFAPAETPFVEYREFVQGENKQDEAVSDIFKLKDKGERDLALRYEFTFQLRRLMQNKKLPYKRYQIGEVFRDEPITANRFRQFTQCDVDIVGSKTKDEAEIIALTKEILDKLGIKFVIYFNNRKLLNEILDKEGIKEKIQVIKEIDKLDKLSEKEIRENLKKFNAENILNIFTKPEKYFEAYQSYSEIKELKEALQNYGIEKEIRFLPSLARGLSYYNGNVFEIKTEKIKETICAGGSYVFNSVQCTGISFGLDRLAMLVNIISSKNSVLVVSLNEDKQAIKIADKLRKMDNNVSIFYGKPSKAMEYANACSIKQVIFVGAEEIKKKQFKVKDMTTGKEKILTLEKKTKKNVVVQRK